LKNVNGWHTKGFLVDLVGIEPTTSSMPWRGKMRKLLALLAPATGQFAKNRAFRRFVTPN
jgi:hypothetical protein